MHRLLLGLAGLLALVLAAAPVAAAPRLALVVGNAAYPGRPLATAAADAGLVAQALAQAGYAVTAARDLDGKGLRMAFRAFADTARDAGPDATILVYLAGYGVQYDGNNYMVPVDAALAHDDDVPLRCADLDDLLRALAAAPAQARLLLYDLARDSPLAATDEMPLAPGLALASPPKDTLVGFAAAPGMVAPRALLPYGPYARALAEGLGTSGLGASAMLERLRLRVATLTNGAQIPWNAGTLSADATPISALDRLPAGTRSPDVAFAAVLARDSLDGYTDFLRAVPDGPLAARVRVLLALRREATMWRAVASADDPRAAWTYMRRYPRGPHRFDARRRLAALKAQLEPPPRFDPVVFPEAPPPNAGELALVAHPREAQRGLPPIPAPPEALLPPANPAYYGDLAMPTPAPRDLLPVASPLPQDRAIEPGKITQAGPTGETTSETYVAPNGASTLTLSDEKGPFLIFATRVDSTGTRVTTETGPKGDVKGDVKSRTTTTHAGDATTIVLADAAGSALSKIVVRDDPDGSRTTRVTDGDGIVIAAWRRDGAGIVVASETSGEPLRPAPAPAAPVPPAPTSPTIAVPMVPKPPLHAAPPAQVPAPAAAAPAPPAPTATPVAPKPAPVAPPPLAPAPPSPKKAPLSSPPAPAPTPAPIAPPVIVSPPAPAPAPMAPQPAPAVPPPAQHPVPSVPPTSVPAPIAPPIAPPLAMPAPVRVVPPPPVASPAPAPAPIVPPAPEPPPPPTPPAAPPRVPLPPPRPADARPREHDRKRHKPADKPTPKPAAKAHAKPAPHPSKAPKSAPPHRKGKGAR